MTTAHGTAVEQHTARAGDVTLAALTAGSGDPPVLLHGFPQHSHVWRPLIPRLAARYTVIAPDLRGMGGSSLGPYAYDKRTLAADVRALARGVLGVGRVRLAGYDQGANAYHVFDRTTFTHLGVFAGARTRLTDGVALTQRAFGPFSAGAFYASHLDGGVSAFGWAEIAAALGLRADCRASG